MEDFKDEEWRPEQEKKDELEPAGPVGENQWEVTLDDIGKGLYCVEITSRTMKKL